MGRTEAKSGQAAKRPMAATSGASPPRNVSVLSFVADLEGRDFAERRPKPALVGDGEAIADDGAGKRRAAAREPQSLPSYLKETLSLVR